MQPPKHPIRRILFIDDDEDDFVLFQETLKSIDPSITVSFVQGCDKDLCNFPWVEADLIFLDLNMPRCNGFECLRRLKTSPLKDTPVVIFTTSQNPLHIEKAYQFGATLFLSKPFSYTTMVKSIQGLLTLDWDHPAAITSQYCTDGRYKAYTAG